MELATQLLDSATRQPAAAWVALGEANWALHSHKLPDGTEARSLRSMNLGGGPQERLTGTLKSKTFAAPAKLALWINGHRGFPNAAAHEKNLVRVVDVQTGETLAQAFPPRNDIAQRVELDLTAHVGKPMRLELVDGDATGKEHRISKTDVAKSEVTPISLMPPAFGQLLNEATFNDLLGYLLGEK